MKRTEQLEKTRRAILQTATRLFLQKGFAQTSTRDIAKEIGITQPALYHHFSDKEVLFLSVMTEFSQKVHQDINKVLRKHKTQIYFKGLFIRKNDTDKFYYSVNKWLEYFLKFVLDGYKTLSEELNLNAIKKETKTKRIEKIVNSTLGYFTKDDIRLQCPDIPEPTINRVFNNLRKSGKIEVVAKGRSAKWKRV